VGIKNVGIVKNPACYGADDIRKSMIKKKNMPIHSPGGLFFYFG
jgi:hypothetical protein